MSQDKQMLSYGTGIVVSQDSLGNIMGRTLTIIESLGLEVKQEKAIKDLVRDAIYKDDHYYVYIDGDLHTDIRVANDSIKMKAGADGDSYRMVNLKDIK